MITNETPFCQSHNICLQRVSGQVLKNAQLGKGGGSQMLTLLTKRRGGRSQLLTKGGGGSPPNMADIICEQSPTESVCFRHLCNVLLSIIESGRGTEPSTFLALETIVCAVQCTSPLYTVNQHCTL